jgi:hypothetical protein
VRDDVGIVEVTGQDDLDGHGPLLVLATLLAGAPTSASPRGSTTTTGHGSAGSADDTAPAGVVDPTTAGAAASPAPLGSNGG